MTTDNSIRPSPIAGSWYSADAGKLSKEINGYIDSAINPPIPGKVIGLIAPHAGYFYSGATAGHSYKAVKGYQYDLCVVVSPFHNNLPDPLLTSAHLAYQTPLGKIEVDQELMTEFGDLLVHQSLPIPRPIANDREHSLEIQLPFLQVALDRPFRLLPLMVRTTNPATLQGVGETLSELISGKNALLVASTDLSHFYNHQTANQYDEVMLKRMADLNPDGVLDAEFREEGFACGSGAVAVVLWAAKSLGADKVTLLHHSTSAEASGDKSSVVGYGALVITKPEVV